MGLPRVSIRLARRTDESGIVDFINTHWRKDHVFVTHPEVLRWQHQTDGVEGLSFVLATRDAPGGGEEILGLLGYIPFRRWDSAADWTALSLAIWKVRDNLGLPGLGLRLLKFLRGEFRPDLICAIGITDIVRPIYQALGYEVGTMSHAALFPEASHSRAGETMSCVVAAGAPTLAFRPLNTHPGISLEPITHSSALRDLGTRDIARIALETTPPKSLDYIQTRYFDHPFHAYEIRAVRMDGVLVAILVWRRVEASGRTVLRIVDVIGDPNILAKCGSHLRAEIEAADCEYCDLVYYGIDPEILEEGGFVDRGRHDGLILPNYFDPFVQKNVTLQMAYRWYGSGESPSVRLYRADSDQDRPNSGRAITRHPPT